MEIINGKDKTTQIIKLCAQDNLLMVCFNYAECNRVRKMALGMKLGVFPVTFEDFQKFGLCGRSVSGAAIDNLDTCLGNVNYLDQVKIVSYMFNRKRRKNK